MKRIVVLFVVALISVLSCYAFTVEDKNIVLPGFSGYKYQDETAIRDMMADVGMDAKSLMLPSNASSAGFDVSGNYNDYFIVATNPEMLFGFDLSEEDFGYLLEGIKEEYIKGGLKYDVDSMNSQFSNKYSISFAELSEPRIILDNARSLAFSTLTKIDGYNYVIGINGLVLVKGKTMWVYYYREYNSPVDYDTAISIYSRYISALLSANEETAVDEASNSRAYKEFKLILDQPTKKISSEGHSNAYGIKYDFEVPTSFVEGTSSKPHIVNTISFALENGCSGSVAVTVDDRAASLIKALGSSAKISDLYSDTKEVVPAGYTCINSGFTTVGGIKAIEAIFMELHYSQKIYDGMTLDLYAYQIVFVQDGALVSIMFGIGGEGSLGVKEIYEMYKPLFFRITNSFQPYLRDSAVSRSNSSSDVSRAVYTFAVMIFIIPFAVVIVLALILRFGMMHRSISKNSGLLASTVLGLVMMVILYSTGGEIGSLIAILCALLFYAILRIGHAEYDREQIAIKLEREAAQKMYREADFQKAQAASEFEKAKKARSEAETISAEAEQARRESAKKVQEAEYEINRLVEELKRVMERNRKLEDEAQMHVGSRDKAVKKDKAYYESVLGLSSYYSKSELKKAYLEKTRLYHPDRVSSLGEKLRAVAEEEMKDINNAYSYLQTFAVYER